jgi:hypothetical protein
MAVRAGLVVLALSQLALAVWQIADPSGFHGQLADFGPQNDHYLHDLAAWEATLAVCALVAVWRASWRVPVLAFAALQFVLHTISHIADASDARGDTDGTFDAVSLGIGALLLVALALLARREEPARV